jgi:isocitrate lyase
MAGKVIVATKEHCNRLIAVRLQADIMGSPLVLCARTDSLNARFIDSNIDPKDHPYILGIADPARRNEADLVTFVKAGESEILRKFSGPQQS